MGDYTKLTHKDAKEILSIYGKNVSDNLDIKSLSLGISNSNYKVNTGSETLLLKVSNDKNYEELKEEMEILKILGSKGFQFSLMPLRTSKDELTYQYQDLYGVIFPFIDGIPPGPSDQSCFEIGKGLALLHNINVTHQEKENIRNHEKVGFGPKQILEYTKSTSCPQDFKETFHQLFPHQLTWFIEHNWDKGIIHGDLYIDNTMFNDNKLHVFLDFEQGGIGEYILDLGITISGCCLEKGQINQGLVQSLVKGYQEHRNLSSHERQNLADSILLGLLSISLWRIKRFKDKNMNPIMANSYKELLLRARCFREQFKTIGLL
jgi:homoserine kinase type II